MGESVFEMALLTGDYIASTDENKQAVYAALSGLFERYPTISSGPCTWRDKSLRYAMDGNFDLAFHWAHGTGIPDDELLSIALLFSK